MLNNAQLTKLKMRGHLAISSCLADFIVITTSHFIKSYTVVAVLEVLAFFDQHEAKLAVDVSRAVDGGLFSRKTSRYAGCISASLFIL